jgi:kynurenine formamidase
MCTAAMTEAEFRTLYERLRRSIPWPPEDRRGALNYITPAEIRAAAAEVSMGAAVSLAAPVESRVTADDPDPARHRMTGTAADAPAAGLSFAMDRLEMNIHGNVDTHLDALCHVMFDGHLYNGVPADTVTAQGAAELSVEVARDGITGRGVLLDIPRLRGVRWLEPGDCVTADDLARAADTQQVEVRRGDLLFVRVGHRRRRAELGPWDAASARAGLHPTAMEFVAERQVAVLGSDSNNDCAGNPADQVEFPVHVLAINALGLHLLDYLQFGELLPVCEQAGRWSFMCVIAPLRLPAGTGSPVNPIAIL